MKRKLFIAGATFVLVAAAVTAIAANRQTNKPTLLEANIEALESRGVGGGGEGGGTEITCISNPVHNNGPGVYVCADGGCRFEYNLGYPAQPQKGTCYQ